MDTDEDQRVTLEEFIRYQRELDGKTAPVTLSARAWARLILQLNIALKGYRDVVDSERVKKANDRRYASMIL